MIAQEARYTPNSLLLSDRAFNPEPVLTNEPIRTPARRTPQQPPDASTTRDHNQRLKTGAVNGR